MMSLLIYCIMEPPIGEKVAEMNGVGERPVSVVSSSELAAAVSDLTDLELTTETANILAYSSVVAAFHHLGTVIPLRYGATCKDESHLVKQMEEKAGKCLALLRELDGYMEIGIRILLSDLSIPEPDEPLYSKAELGNQGRAFLNDRRAHYFPKERALSTYLSLAEGCRTAFAGLFVRCREESPSLQCPLLSLYFLVPRGSVEPFRAIFRHLSAGSPTPLLMSGPWPPYNFVGSDIG